jgi:alkylation response protein AidB-like acyl-CoA dehydrogenase
MIDYREAIETIASGVVRAGAVAVDRDAAFPSAGIEALRDAGLLGLVSAREVGGRGEGLGAAAAVIERLAQECGSTAMVLCMHYAATAVVEVFGSDGVRRDNAAGKHLLTLAFSELGSRSHFWAPVGRAERREGAVHLHGRKSWVTSANHATAFVWSSRPVAADGASTLWLVPAGSPGLASTGAFDGLGLRGNDSTPMVAEAVRVGDDAMLGGDGGGLTIMLQTVLPIFNVMTAACAVGLMEGATGAACAHASATGYEHLGSTLAEQPTLRAYLARMRIATDATRALLVDTVAACTQGREDATLRVLECKAAAGEAATQVLDLAMRVCGGAAFRREFGVERRFRDGRAGTVMAPTTDQLYDFIGKAICGLPVF